MSRPRVGEALVYRPFRRPLNAWAAATLVLLVFVEAGNLSLVRDAATRANVSDFLQTLAAAVVLAAIFAAARRLRREASESATAWTLFGAGATFFCAGQVAFWLVALSGRPVGYPNFADPFYLVGYAVLLAGLSRLPRDGLSSNERWNVVLDLAILTIVTAVAVWEVSLRDLVAALRVSGDAASFVSLAYTVLNVVLLLALYFGLVVNLGRGRAFVPNLLLVGAGLCLTISDLAMGRVAVTMAFTSGSPIDIGWMLAAAFAGLAGLKVLDGGDETEVGQSAVLVASWSTALIYACLAGGATVLVWELTRDGSVDGALLWSAASATLALSFLRQLRIMRHSARLADALERSVGDLEAKVLERTAELSAAADSLRESEEKYRVLWEMDSDALVLVDNATGRILEANAAAVALYELDRRELLALTNASLSAEPEETVRANTATDITPGQLVAIPLRWHRRKDGSAFPVEIRGRFFTWKGKPVHIAAIRDITARRAAERETERLQEQLTQAEKMETVGRLAGGVAHDFNNMLGVILGNVEFALDSIEPGEPLRADLQEIQIAARRSADLTAQLLAFARRQMIAPEVMDLNDAVSGMLAMLGRLIGEDVTLVWQPAPKLWATRMDPSQLASVLTNLCLNARHAIEDTGTLTISTANCVIDEAFCAANADAVPGEHVRLKVRDTGCGMDEETMARIFEPFFTTKEVGEGTGLGLASVYGAVRQNDGFITVSSAPGTGTAFEVYLPRNRADVQPGYALAVADPASGGLETILLVEDEPGFLQIAAKLLERRGYTVLQASGPGEAARKATAHPGEIHLLLTDLVMPDMNGRDLAKSISSLRPRLRFVFMSGYSADVLAHRGVVPDGADFLQKPFLGAELTAKVREVLDREPYAVAP